MAEDKIDIKTLLRAIDTRDFSWYNSLTDSEKKKLAIWQVMRFVSSCESKNKDINMHYLTLTNDLVNVNFNVLRHYPDLQFRLLQICGIGAAQYHSWIAPGKREKNDKVRQWISDQFPSYNDDELDLFIKKNSIEYFKELAIEKGLQDKEIKEIFGK